MIRMRQIVFLLVINFHKQRIEDKLLIFKKKDKLLKIRKF